MSFWYGKKQALCDISLSIPERSVMALIGPSGCGKSTFLRSLNRMNDLIEGTRHVGDMLLDGEDIYSRGVNLVDLRRRVGMVFQKSNPFPKSIFENVVYGPRVAGLNDRARLMEIAERCLRGAALWDEVKDRLRRLGAEPVRRSAAAAVHRPRPGHRPGSAAAGRAGLGPRPGLHGAHRGPDLRAEARLHHRHRDAQHAAGGPRLRPDGLLLPGPADRGRLRPTSCTPGRRSSRPRTTSRAGSAESIQAEAVSDAARTSAYGPTCEVGHADSDRERPERD